MTFLAPNGFRGLVGLVGIILMVAGAGALWGWGAAMFVCGLYIVIDATSDEAVERFTRTTRYRQDGSDPVGGSSNG